MRYEIIFKKRVIINSDSEDHAYELALERINEDGFEPDEADVHEYKVKEK